MNNHITSNYKRLLSSLSILILVSCGTKSDEPGVCNLSCSNAVIGASHFKIEPLTTSTEYQCKSPGEIESPIVVKFAVFEEGKFKEGKHLKPGVSVDPIVTGFVSTDSKIPSENGSRYAGIATPKSDFCSDSCGMVTLELYPVCLAEDPNIIRIQLFSGALKSDEMVINVVQPNASVWDRHGIPPWWDSGSETKQ